MQKIKPEFVNEMEFEKDRQGDYTYDFKANLSIKVYNSVSNCHLRRERYGDNKGEVVVEFERNWEKQLKDFDIELDTSDIINYYKEKLKGLEEERTRIEYEKALRFYDNSWIHNALTVVKSFNDPELSVAPSHLREDIVPSEYYSGFNIRLSYKNCESVIERDKVDSDFYYTFSNEFTNYQQRKYKSMQNLITKFKGLVDDHIRENKEKEERVNNMEVKKEETIKHFKEVFNIEVTSEKYFHKDYSRSNGKFGYPSDYNRPYYKYFVKVKPNSKEGSQNLSISFNELDYLYKLGGIDDLTAEQVEGIFKVLNSI